jgi:hypothetical protein
VRVQEVARSKDPDFLGVYSAGFKSSARAHAGPPLCTRKRSKKNAQQFENAQHFENAQRVAHFAFVLSVTASSLPI